MSNEHLVIIDMQYQFLKNKPPQEVNKAIETTQKLIIRAREKNYPVTFTTFSPLNNGPLNSNLSYISDDEIVTKNDNDAFTSEAFNNRVQACNLLYIVGCNLEFCVLATVQSAIKRGFKVIVYKNATLARDVRSLRKSWAKLEYWLNPRISYLDYHEEEL